MTEELTMRLAQQRDWPTIQRLHHEQNELQGTHTALPDLFGPGGEYAPNIVLAFMVEQDGVAVSSFYFELVPEICFAGCRNPQATAYARREVDRIAFGLRSMGFGGVNCKVPMHMAEKIEMPLHRAGFQKDEGLVHYFKDLRLQKKIEVDDV